MSPSILAQLIIALGPVALELIPKLSAIWTRPDLTPAEIDDLCAPALKSYAQYRAEAAARHAAKIPE